MLFQSPIRRHACPFDKKKKDLTLARLPALRPRVIFAGSGISALLEPTTTLKTTTEFAFIIDCTVGTFGP